MFHLSPGTLNLVNLRMRVRSTSFETEEKPHRVRVRFSFPVGYTVLDETGQVLDQGSARADWSGGNRQTENWQIAADKKSATAISMSEVCQIRAPDSGQVRVRVKLGTDELYEAEADSLEIRVHENIHDNRRFTVMAGLLCTSRPIVSIVGMLLFLYGPLLIAARSKAKTESRGADGGLKAGL